MLENFRGADWGDVPADVCTSAGTSLFHEVELEWEKPTAWNKGDGRPTFNTDRPFLYILLRDHGNSRTKDQIAYVGLTKSPKTRFGNHETAKAVVAQRGTVRFTYATVDFKGRNRLALVDKG